MSGHNPISKLNGPHGKFQSIMAACSLPHPEQLHPLQDNSASVVFIPATAGSQNPHTYNNTQVFKQRLY